MSVDDRAEFMDKEQAKRQVVQRKHEACVDVVRAACAAWLRSNNVDPSKAKYLENFVLSLLNKALGKRIPQSQFFKR